MIQERKLLEMSHEFIDSVHNGEWGSSTDRDELVIAIEAALAQPVQEPVAVVGGAYQVLWANGPSFAEHACKHVITTPPLLVQREWVGLTDEEMYLNCPNWLSQDQCKKWVQQIEAKLKEKNT